jgi:hypothetical protein
VAAAAGVGGEELIDELFVVFTFVQIRNQAWGEYAQRDETRREHLLELRPTTEIVHSLSASAVRLLRGCCPLFCKPIMGSYWFAQPVVNHYETTFTLRLMDQEKTDLVEYLKSL